MVQSRVLSGVQPTGALHLGNWLGAIRNWVDLQHNHDTFVCVVDLHAITVPHDPKRLAEDTLSTAALYLACGIDPQKSTVFVQSHVPAHAELCWLLNCVTPLNWLERMIQFKEKAVKQGDNVSVGLLDYPVLMAADILIYDSHVVPVGKDQVQHVEMTRDMAERFNHLFGEAFVLPQPSVREAVGTIPGLDGRKMSKSYDNTITLMQTPKKLRKQVMQIVTDSTPLEDPKDPETCNVFNLYKLFATAEEQAELAAKYRGGNFGYGHAKQALFEVMDAHVGPARDRYNALLADTDQLEDFLLTGAAKARSTAREVLDRARSAVGFRAFGQGT